MKRFKIRGKSLLVCSLVALSLLFDGAVRPAAAEDSDGDLVNYSFAIWLGSGFYKAGDADKRFAFLRVPFSYTFREGQYDKPAFRERLGFKLLLPALVGYQEETDTNDDLGAAAFVPGLEVQVPINRYWTLKPFGQAGVGNDTGRGDLQYIYGTGIRSLVSIPYKDFIFGLGNSVILAENRNSSTGDVNGFSMLEIGLDMRTPLGFHMLNRQINFGVFFVASRFSDSSKPQTPNSNLQTSNSSMETFSNILFWLGIVLLVDGSLGILFQEKWQRLVGNWNLQKIALGEISLAFVMLAVHYLLKFFLL